MGRPTARTSMATAMAAFAIFALLPVSLAHGGEEGGMDMGGDEPKPDPASYPQTYFALADHASVLYAHIALMAIAWVIVLPVGVMFSIARSRYTLGVQLAFLVVNAIGLMLGISYNANTPDLYPNNAHHKVGWIATWVVCAQVFIGFVGHVAGVMKGNAGQSHSNEEQQAFIPMSTANMAEHHRLNDDSAYNEAYRHSNDSGQGTEPNTESLRSNSVSHSGQESPIDMHDRRMDYQDLDDLEFKEVELNPSKVSIFSKITGRISTRAWKFIFFGYNVVDRTSLILGYVALATGVITWARFFEGHEIFSGLAHWIKGSIFFWLGLLNLGRWAGSFGELGWAWNARLKSSSKRWRPTAEFVEGALIFTYGSTNIFLEHLGNAGEAFSAQDLEHMSITVLFIGGGLLSMLIESTNIRELLNTTVTEASLDQADHSHTEEERERLEPPRQYEFSINPIPALVILLLGIMMSSHTQKSMISSMVHKQWGNLLTAGAFARGFTYVLMYLRPPRSVMPSRPPTELLAAFGLIAGGIIFMTSASDTIIGMIHYDLDAMFAYTVTMGFSALLMAWVILVLALKGWAVRRESTKLPKRWTRA